MTIRTQLKAGGKKLFNHNEALVVRTTITAGRRSDGPMANHNEALAVRTSVKGGRPSTDPREGTNHNETLHTRTGLKAGALRRAVQITARKGDRLELLVVRAGLRAGRRDRRPVSR